MQIFLSFLKNKVLLINFLTGIGLHKFSKHVVCRVFMFFRRLNRVLKWVFLTIF